MTDCHRTDLYHRIEEAIRQGRPDAPDLLRHPRVRRHRKSLCERWLKLAVDRKRIEVIDVLNDHASRHVPCLNWALQHNDLDFLKYLATAKKFAIPADFAKQAFATGNLAIVEWLNELQTPMFKLNFGHIDRLLPVAAAAGHIHLLKWCIDKLHHPIHWYSEISIGAAAAGRLDVLQWCKETGVPIRGDCGREAAKKGHLEIVQWLWSNVYVHPVEVDCLREAAARGYLELLRWGWDRCFYLTSPDIQRLACEASAGGHVHVLEYLIHQTRATLPSRTGQFCLFEEAIRQGHLHMLRWLHQTFGTACEDHTTDHTACAHHTDLAILWAPQNTRLDILKWLQEIGTLNVTENTLERCLSIDELKVTQWILDQGCPVSEENFIVECRKSARKQARNQSFLWALLYTNIRFTNEFCIRRIRRLLRYQIRKKQFGFMCHARNSSLKELILPEQHQWMHRITQRAKTCIESSGVVGPLVAEIIKLM